MLSDQIGIRLIFDGDDFIRTRRGEMGHAVYGPYRLFEPGTYRADYRIARLDRTSDANAACATLDVTAREGQLVLAARTLHVGELKRTFELFPITFTLDAQEQLEFRVFAHGTAELMIADDPEVGRLPDQPASDQAG